MRLGQCNGVDPPNLEFAQRVVDVIEIDDLKIVEAEVVRRQRVVEQYLHGVSAERAHRPPFQLADARDPRLCQDRDAHQPAAAHDYRRIGTRGLDQRLSEGNGTDVGKTRLEDVGGRREGGELGYFDLEAFRREQARTVRHKQRKV